jgi:thiol-disulfide isomerase/thioredoxin
MKIKLIAFVLLTLTVFAACSNTSTETKQATVEQTAGADTKSVATTPVLPAFKVMGMDGSIINLASLKGKKVFVNLWATWCPPCKAEIPSIEKLYSKVDKQKTAFVMLSLDDNFDLAKQFSKTNNMQLPVYYPAEKLPAMFNTDGIPATFIFNEKGELIKTNTGMEDYDTETYLQMFK